MSKYPEYSHVKSHEWFDRAPAVIPAGVYGHLEGRRKACFCRLNKWPLIASKAKGTYFWDMDGNRYLDLMCAYGPNVLGYCDPDVDKAAIEQLSIANCTPRLPTKWWSAPKSWWTPWPWRTGRSS